MKKRGVAQQVFTYIAAAIIIGAVFLFGFMAYGQIDKTNKESQMLGFETEMKNDLENIASKYGSVDFKNYRFPPDVGEVVFVDIDKNSPDISAGLNSEYPIIAQQVKDGTKDSVYLLDTKGKFLKSLEVGELSIQGPGWIAYKNINGRFEMKMEGAGSKSGVGGKFEITEVLTTNVNTIELPQIPGLKLVLQPGQYDNNCKGYYNPTNNQCCENYNQNTDTCTGTWQNFGGGNYDLVPPNLLQIKLWVEQSTDDVLTDTIMLQTLDSNGEDYPGTIKFDFSYIQIPVSSCEEVEETEKFDVYDFESCQIDPIAGPVVRYTIDYI